MNATTTAPHVVTEASAWLRGTAGAQLRRLRQMGAPLDDPACPLFLAPLVGRLTEHGTEDDRRCDRCGRYCPPSEVYLVGMYAPHPRVRFVVGLCAEHAAVEGVTR